MRGVYRAVEVVLLCRGLLWITREDVRNKVLSGRKRGLGCNYTASSSMMRSHSSTLP